MAARRGEEMYKRDRNRNRNGNRRAEVKWKMDRLNGSRGVASKSRERKKERKKKEAKILGGK